MELTREQAQEMISQRLRQYPEIGGLVSEPSFKQKLVNILSFEGIAPDLFSVIENNLVVVLAFFAPLSELANNISNDTGIEKEKADAVVNMIDSILLRRVKNELEAFDYHWKNELTTSGVPAANSAVPERLDLRPNGVPPSTSTMPTPPAQAAPAHPLTREELLRALAAKRTMATDIEAVRQQQTTVLPGIPQSSNPDSFGR